MADETKEQNKNTQQSFIKALREAINEAKKNGSPNVSLRLGTEQVADFLETVNRTKKHKDKLPGGIRKPVEKAVGFIAKSIVGAGDWLDKPVENKVDGYAYKNNGQMIAGRTNTAFEWTVDSVGRPLEEAANALSSGKFEDLIINVPMAMADQLLKILDGLNNWIKNIERHPKLGQIKDIGDITQNLSKPGNDNNQTTNISKPANADTQTKNIGKPENNGNQTENIPPAQGRTDSQTTNVPPVQGRTGGQTTNVPPAQGRADSQTTNVPPAQGRTDSQTTNVPPAQGRMGEPTAEPSVGSTISNLSSTTEKIADITMKASAFVAPIIPEAVAVAGVAATVKAVAQQGQKVGETLDPKASAPTPTNSPQVKTPPVNAPQTNTPQADAPTITPKGNSTPPAGLKLNNVAAFFTDKTITVKNDTFTNLNQSRTARDNANQCKQLGNMLAMIKNRNNSRAQTKSMGPTLPRDNRTASIA